MSAWQTGAHFTFESVIMVVYSVIMVVYSVIMVVYSSDHGRLCEVCTVYEECVGCV